MNMGNGAVVGPACCPTQLIMAMRCSSHKSVEVQTKPTATPPWLLGAMPVFRIPERTVPSLHRGSIGSSRRICAQVSRSKSYKREGFHSATNILPAANPLFHHSGKQGTNRSLSCCKCPFSPRKSPPCTESDHTGGRVRRAEGQRTCTRARIRRRTARPETSTTMVST